ncbi:methyltransferase family protein [Lutibacter sp. Hel_I_33_5]|uniref:class I SAM-dependent methyltransferase n=1 Tax=Lutibacter sp. Hel_I_33_5 TaxID=1566289 RepID=UPI0011A8627F|nr:class I SAM-dependent methyltransferase [Lutibacter sp. Hel_I_33_5]TVZ56391.1 methyltransferase family protein [Lutibacter sp. Hel_I_33_5]
MSIENKLNINLDSYLTCKDYTVSNTSFQVQKNKEYELLVTQPIPKNLEDYYKSEDYISHTDSKKSLTDILYQTVKNYTLKKKISLLNSFKTDNKKVLDFGAGTGDFLGACKNNNWEVFGVEPNLKAREIAAKKGITILSDISELKNIQFDVITLWHVLEHVEKLEETILRLKELLTQNGVLIIAVPNYKSYDANHYKEFWAAYDVPRHLWHFSQTSISKIFSEFSMNVEKTLPMKFDSYYVSLLSEKYKTGKTNFFKAFKVGFLSNKKAKKTTEYSSLIYCLKKS